MQRTSNAFRSFNYPVLAEAGIHIKYNNVQIRFKEVERELKPHYLLDTNVAVLKLFPGIQENVVSSILSIEGLKAVVLETYGSGNAPRKGVVHTPFAECLRARDSHRQRHPV